MEVFRVAYALRGHHMKLWKENLSCNEDPTMLEISEPWPVSQEQLQTGEDLSQETCILQTAKPEEQTVQAIRHQTWSYKTC